MMGAISVVVDSHACPCLCLDALPSSNMNVMSQKGSTGGLALQRNNIINPVAMRRNLSSSFIDSGHERRVLAKTRNHKKQRKPRSLLIVSELGGQYEDTFEDVKAQLRNYFTYKAVRTVLSQLYEMNPTQYRWFYDFVATNQPGDGKRFIRILVKEKQDLAERVMVTRLHLYGKWVKKFDHAAMYKEISDQNLELMRERLMETVIWPSDNTNTETIG